MPLAERKLIARIRGAARGAKCDVLRIGIGDDCAVLRPPRGEELLVTTDFTIEGTHFRRAIHPPESVGHRCLARGLSDVAAMGGEPLAAFLSLGLPPGLPQRWTDGFMGGLLGLARRWRVPLAGGDVSSAPGLIVADIIVVGSVPRGRVLLRSGARAGDFIYVTGRLGAAALAVRNIMSGKKPRPADFPAHFYPKPRLAIGRALRERKLATAAIDISDGLSTDLQHLCEESGAGAVIYERAIPVAKGSTLDLALHGGEDYELLFTSSRHVPPRIGKLAVTRIGEIVRGDRVSIADAAGQLRPLRPAGWEHFAKSGDRAMG